MVIRSALVAVAAAALLIPAAGAAQAQPDAEEPTLFERLGGLPAIALVVSDFMDVFVQDPLILSNPAVRERKGPDAAPYITYQVTTLLCQAAGGPCEYRGRDLARAHAHLNVSEREWDRMVTILSETLERHGVPEAEQEELFAILGPTKEDIVRSGGSGGR